jgi:large subunit ribosomal protein L4
MVLSDRVKNNAMIVVDSLEMAEYKTKKFNEILSAVEKKILNNDRRDILIINDAKDDKVKYSGRNLVGTKIINLENVNLIDLLNYKNLLLTEKAVEAFTKRYNK